MNGVQPTTGAAYSRIKHYHIQLDSPKGLWYHQSRLGRYLSLVAVSLFEAIGGTVTFGFRERIEVPRVREGVPFRAY